MGRAGREFKGAGIQSFWSEQWEGLEEGLVWEGPLGAQLWASFDIQEIRQWAVGCMNVDVKGVDEKRFICESLAYR